VLDEEWGLTRHSPEAIDVDRRRAGNNQEAKLLHTGEQDHLFRVASAEEKASPSGSASSSAIQASTSPAPANGAANGQAGGYRKLFLPTELSGPSVGPGGTYARNTDEETYEDNAEEGSYEGVAGGGDSADCSRGVDQLQGLQSGDANDEGFRDGSYAHEQCDQSEDEGGEAHQEQIAETRDDATDGVMDDREACASCGRYFANGPLARHQEICQKVFGSKRKKFNMTSARMGGLVNKQEIKMLRRSMLQEKKKTPVNKGPSKWRKEHEDFVQAMRACREISAEEGAKAKAGASRNTVRSRSCW